MEYRRPSSIISLALISLLSAGLLMSAVPSASDPLKALPPGAMAIVSAGKPLSLLANARAFARNAGIEEAVAALDKAAAAMGDPEAAGPAALLRHLDPGRRVVVAAYPGKSGQGQAPTPAILAFIPVKKPADALKAFNEALAGQAAAGLVASVSSTVSGYLVLAMGMEAPSSVDKAAASGPAFLSLSAYPDSSVALWVDAAAAMDGLGPLLPGGLKGLLSGSGGAYQEVDYGGQEDEAPFATDPFGSLTGLLDAYRPFAEGVLSMDLGVVVSEDRLWLRGSLGLDPGSPLGILAASAPKGSSSLPYLKYCQADALVSGAWSMPADSLLPLLKPLYGIMLPDPELAALFMDSMDASAAATGLNGAFSLNIGLTPALATAIRNGSLSAGGSMDPLREGLSLDCSVVTQLADRQAYRNALAASMKLTEHPLYARFMDGEGMRMSYDAQSGSSGGVPWDRYSMRLDPGASAAAGAGAQALILELLGGYEYWYKGDKAYCGIGTASAPKDLAARDGAQKPLTGDKAFASLRSGASPDVKAIFYVPSRPLAGLYLKFAPKNGPVAAFDMDKLSGLLCWLSAAKGGPTKPATLGGGYALGAEEIRAIISLSRM